jgi:hypothetical protein
MFLAMDLVVVSTTDPSGTLAPPFPPLVSLDTRLGVLDLVSPARCLILDRMLTPFLGSTCLWYTGAGCTGTQSGAVNAPGYEVVPGFWQFNTASWKCWN